MRHFIVLALAASAGLCSSPAGSAESAGHVAPARVEAMMAPDAALGKAADPSGASIKKIILTRKAAERLGIELDEVRVDPAGRRIVPYTSVLYDLTGKTWVYVRSDELTFFREAVSIDTIHGDNAYLKEGPTAGTKVLAAGVAQVFGTEAKVGH